MLFCERLFSLRFNFEDSSHGRSSPPPRPLFVWCHVCVHIVKSCDIFSLPGLQISHSSSPRTVLSTGGEGSAGTLSWQDEAASCAVNEDDLCDLYVSALEESKFDSTEMSDTHTLAEKAEVTLDPRSPMVAAVLRDMKLLQEASLIHPDSAIFVRQVSEHMEMTCLDEHLDHSLVC